MDAHWLRERFLRPRPYVPISLGDRPDSPPETALCPAAVLIALVDRPAGLQVLLTRRTAHLHHHAGQISFPGGRMEPQDQSAEAAALRETEEEIGLSPRCVEILGCINRYVTITGYEVTPVVGLVRPPFSLALDEFEVAEVFEVPLRVVLDPAYHQRNTVVTQDARRQYHAIPHEHHYIWGATAAMLLNFHSFLTAGTTSQVQGIQGS